MNERNEGKSTNISRNKLFSLVCFKEKTKSNRSLTLKEDLLYDCELFFAHKCWKSENDQFELVRSYKTTAQTSSLLQILGKIIPGATSPQLFKTIFFYSGLEVKGRLHF